MTAVADQPAGQWIQSPRWDGTWMFSGLWAPALVALTYVALTSVAGISVPLDWVPTSEAHLLGLFVTFGILHRLSSIYTVLFTPILRDTLRENPRRYFHVPAMILVGSLLLGQAMAFHTAFSFMPSVHAQMWGFFLLAYVYILWDRWHFCAQEFGVLSLYRVRAKQFSASDRAFDRGYTVLLMLFVNAVLFMGPGFPDQREILFYGTPLATWGGSTLDGILLAACGVGVLAMCVAVVREWRHRQRSLPKLLFYVLVGTHSLLLYFWPQALGLFFLGYIFHHWMVAVGLFNRVLVASYGVETRAAVAIRYLVQVGPPLAACVLFYFFFAALNKPVSLWPPPTAQTFAGLPVAMKVFVGIVVGLFFAFNYLHYYYDRCLYNFRNPSVRASVAPLLFGAQTPAQPRAS